MVNVNLVLVYNNQEFIEKCSFLAEKFSVKLTFVNEGLVSDFLSFREFVSQNSIDGVILESNLRFLKDILEFSDDSYLDVFKVNSIEGLESNLEFEKHFSEFLKTILEDIAYFQSFEKLGLVS